MYHDMALHNDAERFEIALMERRIARSARFEHLKPRVSRWMSAILSMLALLHR